MGEDGTNRSSVTFQPQEGVVLGGRYRLEAPIESGAAGAVWRGRHVSIGKRVAIKILKAEHAASEDDWATKRMLREAQLLSEISHPAVVDVLDFGDHEGCSYIVMELLDGRSLSAALKAEGAMPWRKAGPLLQQLIGGLAAAHQAGVIHRDLKPANIMLLAGDTRAKLIDFGIAGALRRTRITMDGEVLGTPHFMSPEQSRTMTLGETSDIYSFGCVAFSMLAGRPPYVGPIGEVVKQHMLGPVPKVSDHVGTDVPAQVCTTIQRCMAKEPTDRFASMDAVHQALLGRPPGTQSGAHTGRTRIRARKRQRGVIIAVVAGGVMAAGLLVAALSMWTPGNPGKPSAVTPSTPAAAPMRETPEPTRPPPIGVDPVDAEDPEVRPDVGSVVEPLVGAPALSKVRKPRRGPGGAERASGVAAPVEPAAAETPVEPAKPEAPVKPAEPEVPGKPVATPEPAKPDTSSDPEPGDPRWGLKNPFDR